DALRGHSTHLFEPNEISRRSLQHQLTFWGLDYEIANTLDVLRNNIDNHSKAASMALVVLGVDSKHLDEDALSRVCQLAHNKNLRVLCVVDSVESSTHQRLRSLGCDQVLAKSIPRSSLYRSLSECLQQEQAQPPLHDSKVLIAENNSASQRYLQSMLKTAGAHILIASNGDETLQRWQQDKPRFVLLDFNMGSARGDEITKRIREIDPSGSTVIIGMSAHLTPNEERQWYEAGLDSLLIKPFDQAQFLRCIHPWLNSALNAPVNASESSGAKLVNDPELAALMLEELPIQLQELDDAFVQGAWEAARAAAHQLHGTAAFFHLEPLKSHVFLLETRLNKDDSPGDNLQLRDDVIKVTQDVNKILLNLQSGHS
ncbi:MAG: response regulator, partial [Oceanococcus sp.]